MKYKNIEDIVVRAKDSRLTVLSMIREKGKDTLVVCRCTCGNVKTLRLAHVVKGHVRSCGCLGKDSSVRAGKGNFRHGHGSAKKRNATYQSWTAMWQRCRNEKLEYYGAKGITVCEEWRLFENFLSDMGERPPNMSLDRINGNGNYEQANCRWATPRQQCRNRRSNTLILFDGVEMPVAEVAERVGMPYKRLHQRLSRGWSVEAAVQTPVKGHM